MGPYTPVQGSRATSEVSNDDAYAPLNFRINFHRWPGLMQSPRNILGTLPMKANTLVVLDGVAAGEKPGPFSRFKAFLLSTSLFVATAGWSFHDRVLRTGSALLVAKNAETAFATSLNLIQNS